MEGPHPPGPDSHQEIGGSPPQPEEERSAPSSAGADALVSGPDDRDENEPVADWEDESIEAHEDESAGAYEGDNPGRDLAIGRSGYQGIARLSANPDAVEIFRSIGQMFDALGEERRLRTAADEQSRHLEVSKARLEAELELERTLRRLAESELARLRKEDGERRKRAQRDLDRLLAAASDEPEEGAPRGAEVSPTAPRPPEDELGEEVAPRVSPPPPEQGEASPVPPPQPEPPAPPALDASPPRRRWFAGWRGRGSAEP
jgi:hypothetical protein